MAPKRKAEKAAEAASKKAKTAEPKKEAAKKEAPKKEEPKKEEPKKEDPPKEEKPAEKEEEVGEKEQDDKKDSRPTIKDTAISFDPVDTTLNVVTTTGGKVLMSLSDGGMQFLISGARANVGVKAGRYLYEVKILEALTPVEGAHGGRSRPPLPRQLVRVGFSTAGSSLILGDTEDSVAFDSEGFFLADKKKATVAQRFNREMIIGVLLNLDPKSPNANTVSLFRNGERASKPQPLPEKLRGQPLFPHLSFRNVTLQVNWGANPLTPTPFKCRMLQDAAQGDVKEVKRAVPKDGKYDVLFPVAFPDEGTFEWLDGFLAKNPQYTELSDRMIQDWAVKSGVFKPKSTSWKNSNDKPEYNFGINFMDDNSIRRAVNSIASHVPRHYIVMEVKQNLVAADRAANLKRFNQPHFKKIAHVVMGEPAKDFKEKVHTSLLADKQTKMEASWKAKKLDKERRKQLAERQKKIAETQKALQEARKKELEKAAEKAKEGEQKEGDKKEGEKKEGEKSEGSEAKDTDKKDETAAPAEEKEEDKKDEEKKEEEKKEDGEEKKEEEEDDDEPMPQAELTEEEKKINFKVPSNHDITTHVLNASFAQFCIPEKSEGFDAINYEWQNEAKSKEYLKKWVLERKLTSRVEDLQPGEDFTKKAADFQKVFQEWQNKQKEFEKTKKEEAAKAGKKDSEKKDDDEDEDAKMDVDIFSVDDVCNTGSGEPLFSKFGFEDWALLTLRFELHTLQAAFRKDVNDPDRTGVHENHLLFYYSRYFKKQLNPKSYGKETIHDTVDLVKEAVKIDVESHVLVSQLEQEPEDLGMFVKLQEENRRKRQQRIDAGDETARLDFSGLQQQRAGRGGAGKGEAAAPATTAVVAAVPGAGPRLVPAPRSWQSGGAKGSRGNTTKGAGRFQQAPRLGKGGKK